MGLFPNGAMESEYHEPFVGGGAIFFNLEPMKGSINDINPRLMNFYKIVRDQPDELIELASSYIYQKEEYYRLRDTFNERPENPVEDAAIFLYLNKTGYNGLFRVNSKGNFNVPFGRYKSPRVANVKLITQASHVLQKVEIMNTDFMYVIDQVEEGSFCYLDPPYNPISKTSHFTDYSIDGFGEEDQMRVFELCKILDDIGVVFVQSNSDTPFIRELYGETGFSIISRRTNRMINRNVDSRRSGYELLITNSTLAQRL